MYIEYRRLMLIYIFLYLGTYPTKNWWVIIRNWVLNLKTIVNNFKCSLISYMYLYIKNDVVYNAYIYEQYAFLWII